MCNLGPQRSAHEFQPLLSFLSSFLRWRTYQLIGFTIHVVWMVYDCVHQNIEDKY